MSFPTEPLPAGCLCKRSQSQLDPEKPRRILLSDGVTPAYTPRADCPVHGDPETQAQTHEAVINGKQQ